MATNDTSSTSWSNLPSQLEAKGAVSALNNLFTTDAQYLAFVTTAAITYPVTFGIKSSGSPATILITISNGDGHAKIAPNHDGALFTLSATPDQWAQHFQRTPAPGYQSYFSLFRMNSKQEGVDAVLGSQEDFARYAHVWRRTLELLHDAYCGPLREEGQDELEEDSVDGRYVYIEAPLWEKCKVFVEHSGTSGKPEILFLHTAGSDSRQYHGVMNDVRLREMCDMYAFDLPGHGRSFPSRSHALGAYSNTEDAYVGCIAAVVKKLGLKRPIVCGASMAGQVCLAVAMRHKEVDAGGSIPLEG